MRQVAFALLAVLTYLPLPAAAQAVRSRSAQELYEQACDGGDLVACNVFGLMNETGQGAPQDLDRARELYQRACEGGELVGCTNLGLIYGRGVGVEQDLDRARGEYRVACDGGDRLGCDLLAALDSARATPTDSSSSAPTVRRYFKVGRVADAENVRGLANAVVSVPDLDIQVVSDDQGRVELGRLPPGRHLIAAARFGYEPLDGTLEVPGSAEFLMLMSRAQIDDPLATGRVQGRITDIESQEPLSDVEVAVVGQERARVLSNQEGGFVLRDVKPGLLQVRFSRLGYAPRTATLVVQPGGKGELTAAMSTEAIELPAIDVTASAQVGYLERMGYYRRRKTLNGTQFDREDIELYATSTPLNNLLRRASGIRVLRVRTGGGEAWYAVNPRVQSGLASGPANPFVGGGPCILPIYIDGIRTVSPQIDQILASELEAVEVYSGSDTPVQYAGSNPCGVVLMWTRH